MSFPPQLHYKDCGLDCIGDVPAGWNLVRVRHLLRDGNEGMRIGPFGSQLTLEALDEDGEYKVFGQENVISADFTKGTRFISTEKFKDLSAYEVIADDILITMMGTSGRCGIAPPNLWPGVMDSHLLRIRTNSKIRPQYFRRLIDEADYVGFQVKSRGKGSIMHGLNSAIVKEIRIILPPSDVQDSIENFLNEKTSKIDHLIEEQQRLIELLKEKRQAVISHAVTKGLNPEASMKCSGVDWIGDIPKHWGLFPLKRDLEFVTSGSRGWAENYADEGELFIRIGNLTRHGIHLDLSDIQRVQVPPGAESARTRVKPGDLLFSITAYPGSVAVVSDELEPAYVSQHVALARLCGKRLLPEWAGYLVLSTVGQSYFGAQGYGGTKVQLGLDDVSNLLLTVPPIEEQLHIIEFLYQQTGKFDRLISSANQAIDLLQERRAALISAAVTGKINVTTRAGKPVHSTWSAGFARQVLAAEMLSRCNGPSMGRVKLQKLIHLCECHAQLDEVHGTYSRRAAGPFAPQVMEDVREGLLQQRWFEEYKDGSRYAYRALEKVGEHKQYLPHWEDKQPRIDHVLNLLGGELTRKCEIVSTLYAAWNDLLIESKNPTDAEIIHEASSAERWHESKEKIPVEKWPEALKWMRANGLVPVGYGTHTIHQSDLFTGDRVP